MINIRKHIDDFFREKLGNYRETPPAEAWDELEVRLDGLKPIVHGTSYRWLLHFAIVSVIVFLGVSLGKRIVSGNGSDIASVTITAEPAATASTPTATTTTTTPSNTLPPEQQTNENTNSTNNNVANSPTTGNKPNNEQKNNGKYHPVALNTKVTGTQKHTNNKTRNTTKTQPEPYDATTYNTHSNLSNPSPEDVNNTYNSAPPASPDKPLSGLNPSKTAGSPNEPAANTKKKKRKRNIMGL